MRECAGRPAPALPDLAARVGAGPPCTPGSAGRDPGPVGVRGPGQVGVPPSHLPGLSTERTVGPLLSSGQQEVEGVDQIQDQGPRAELGQLVSPEERRARMGWTGLNGNPQNDVATWNGQCRL